MDDQNQQPTQPAGDQGGMQQPPVQQEPVSEPAAPAPMPEPEAPAEPVGQPIPESTPMPEPEAPAAPQMPAEDTTQVGQ